MADTNIEELLEEQLQEMRLAIFSDATNNSEDEIFTQMLKNAKYIALNVLYPFDMEKDTLPTRIAKDWQVRCALFLYNQMGQEGYTSYSENGLSWSKDSSGIPMDLLNELTPMAGVPK